MTAVPRPFAKVTGPDDAPKTWLGANFWSRAGGPFMWQSYDGDVVAQELAVLAEHGLDVTRSFFFWPHTMPEPDRLDEDVLDRFADFLDRHTAAGMQTIPTFLVGHMSGENWSPSWRGDRDLYTDTWLVARQAWYIRTLTARFADHPAIAGWLISNEMPIYAGNGTRADVSAWAELMVQAVRAGGGRGPVSIGDGAWGVETTGEDNGYSIRDLAPMTDFVGPHVYRMENDVVRSHLKAAFVCELSAVTGQPVVLEEFGVTSDFASDDHAAQYYRQVLHLSLLGGATGWIAWNNTDFDNLEGQDPYRHHAFELHFGLTRVDGTPKPQLVEMAEFRKVLDRVDLARCERLPADATILVPAYLDGPEKFTFDVQERRDIVAALEQAYVAAREADLRVRFARELDDDPDGTSLVIVPSVKALTAPTWRRLRELAQAGATVYASYGLGDCPVQRGPWWTGLEETFGVRHGLRYGMVDPITDDVVEVSVDAALGDLAVGTVLDVPAAGGPDGRARLPIESIGAEVIGTDQHGNAVLTRHRIGSGQAVLSAVPLEYFAARRARANPEPTWQLYRALAVEAGTDRSLHVDDPRVFVDALERDDGVRFVWICNASNDTVHVSRNGRSLQLGPFAIQVLEESSDR